MQDVDLKGAERVIEAARVKAVELGAKVSIAVVDTGAHLKAFVRMDGACRGSIDVATRKARTARLFDRSSGDIGLLSQPGGPLYGIEHSNGGLVTYPGGIPLKNAVGEIIGAVGVAGPSVEDDQFIAEAGAQAI